MEIVGRTRLEVHEIGARLSVDRQIVQRCVKRYLSESFDGLRDRARSGRPPEIERHVWQKLATVVVQLRRSLGGRWLGGRCELCTSCSRGVSDGTLVDRRSAGSCAR